MTTPWPDPNDEPLDLATVAADDQLIDALGRGEPGPADDRVARLLTGWRDDLTPTEPSGYAVADGAPLRTVPGEGVPADSLLAPVQPSLADAVRRIRPLVLGAAAGVIAVATLGLGANAAPGSPLWPVVEVVAPQRADVRAAEQAIELAWTAAEAGRFDDARHMLDQATGHVTQVRDPEVAGRLWADIGKVRDALPAAGREAPDGSRPPPAKPAKPASSPSRGPAGSPSPGGPASRGEPAPGLLPTIGPRLPIPPLPLPSLLPSIPPLPIVGDPLGDGCLLSCLIR